LPVDDAQLAEDLTLRGIAVEGIYDLGAGNGSLYEMDITTNRVDAMNHYGVAREAAAIYGLAAGARLHCLRRGRRQALFRCDRGRGRLRAVHGARAARCEDRRLKGLVCGRGSGHLLCAAGAEADFERRRCDQLCWLAMGQPTHAFDLDKIEGGIVVRRARKGEKLKTLDGVERTLDPEDLVVADHAKALGLAGVMGGWDTMITPATTNVLVEAAWFDPMAVRRTARRHGLHTDASHRFERGRGLQRRAGGLGAGEQHSAGEWRLDRGRTGGRARAAIEARTARRKPVGLALSEVRRILGTTVDEEGITAATVEGVLKALGCG
jgi:phenylalanyl-tRNA synthetase beta chain